MASNVKNAKSPSPGHSRSNTAGHVATPQDTNGKMPKSTSPGQPGTNAGGRVQTPQEFEFETRLVVLNFLGLVPQHQVGSSSGSLNSSQRSDESGGRRSLHSQISKVSTGSISPAKHFFDSSGSVENQSHLHRYLSVQRERTETESTLRKSSGEFEPHDDVEQLSNDDDSDDEFDAIKQDIKQSPVSPESGGSGGVLSPLGSVSEFGKRSGSFSSMSSEQTVVMADEAGEEGDRPSRPSSLILAGSGSPDDNVYPGLVGAGDSDCDVNKSYRKSSSNSQDLNNSGQVTESPVLPPTWITQDAKEKHSKHHDDHDHSSLPKRTSNIVSQHSQNVPSSRAESVASTSSTGMTSIPEGRSVNSSKQNEVPERQNSATSSCSASIDLSTPVSDISSLQWSFRSRASSRASFIDVTQIHDVYSLVKASTLPAVIVPLKEELEKEYIILEKNYQEALKKDGMGTDRESPISSARSPESEVAHRLGLIGDVVQQEYFGPLTQAAQEILNQPTEDFDYEAFRQAAQGEGLIGPQVAGWKQVALLMLFGQKVTYSLLQRGDRHLGRLADYTVQLIEDTAADFIIRQGGWSAVSELEIESPVSVSDVMPFFAEDGPEVNSGNEDSTMNTSSLSVISGTPTGSPQVDGNISPEKACNQQAVNNDVNANVSNTAIMGNLHKGHESLDSGLGDARGATDTPDSDILNEDILRKVQREIQLIRQVSSELSDDHGVEPDEFESLRFGLFLVSAAIMGALIAFAYKKYCHSR